MYTIKAHSKKVKVNVIEINLEVFGHSQNRISGEVPVRGGGSVENQLLEEVPLQVPIIGVEE